MKDCNRCNGTGIGRHGHFFIPEYCPKCLGSGEESK